MLIKAIKRSETLRVYLIGIQKLILFSLFNFHDLKKTYVYKIN